MNIQRLGFIVALALAVSACSSVADRAGIETRMADGQVAEADKLKCKTIVKTGTRLGTRVCKTNREWSQYGAAAKQSAEKMQRNSGAGCPAHLGGC